jgi:hypothetical protein
MPWRWNNLKKTFMADIPTTHTAAYGVQAYAQQTLTKLQDQRDGVPWQQNPTAPASEQSEDQVSLSQKGRELSTIQEAPVTSEQEDKEPTQPKQPDTKGSNQQPLDEAELRQVQQLKQRDTEVRTHEQAHLSTAGQYAAGGPSFSYKTGPNGKRYAVGGSVPIDMGKESTPAATIMKMRTVKRAALAPANPSAADRQIAAQAGMQEIKAMQELQTTQLAESKNASPLSPVDEEMSEAVPVKPGKNNGQEASVPSSTSKEPSQATRQLMTAAYKAMAALA